MNDLLEQLDQLKQQAQALVSDIARNAPPSNLHASALEMLLSIVNVRNNAAQILPATGSIPAGQPPSSDENVVASEVERVGRKLPRWERNQDQINSRILTLFLQLVRGGHTPITEDDLGAAYGDTAEFQRNFMQMKVIAPNNHAKVFDVANNIVSIWPPVSDLVNEYEESVLGSEGAANSPAHGQVTLMKGTEMERKLNSVGKQAFVDHYELFMKHAMGQISRQDTIANLVDKGVSNDAGAAIRVGNAKVIFDNGWERDALRLVLASRRLPHTVVSKARALLG